MGDDARHVWLVWLQPNELEQDYAAFETLLSEFVDAVAQNGNVLLNVEPRGEDAQIPAEQASRLSRFGAWLDRNSEAVLGTPPWARAEATTDTGDPVRFTTKEDTLYVTVLGRPTGSPSTSKPLTRILSRPAVLDPMARPGTILGGAVAGLGALAPLEREAPSPDALGQAEVSR